MSIVRLAHKTRFSVIASSCIEDTRLSWEARGLLIYLLSKKEDWVIRMTDLLSQTRHCIGVRSGRDKVYKLIRELRCAGYLWRDFTRCGGEFVGVEYVVSEDPDLEAGAAYMQELEERAQSKSVKPPFTGLPETVAPVTPSPFTGKPETIDKTERAISIEKTNTTADLGQAQESGGGDSLDAVGAKAKPQAKAHSPAPGEPANYPQNPTAASYAPWHAYAQAYKRRYQSWPLCNTTVLSQMAKVVGRVGDLAPAVATYFVTSDNSDFAKSQCHPVGVLLKNCEGYATRAQQAERLKQVQEQVRRATEQPPVAAAEPVFALEAVKPKAEGSQAGRAALEALRPRRRGMQRVGEEA